MKEMIVILLSAILTQNFVLSKSLGICPFLGVSKKLDSAVGMSLAVTFVMVLATAATWPIQTYLLDQYDLGYMQTIVFILVIAALVQLVEMILKKFIPPLYESLGIYLPLITTNCAVLGVALLNVQENYGPVESLVYGFTGGLGFILAIVLFSAVRQRVEESECPESFRGFPIALISAGLLALSFMGFSGLKVF